MLSFFSLYFSSFIFCSDFSTMQREIGTKEAELSLREAYLHHCREPSDDINEHIPILCK
jgi:hypothetical protein